MERKTLILALLALWLSAGAATAASLSLVTPVADTFINRDKVLIIARVDGAPDLPRVEVIDNGKNAGFLPVKGGVVVALVPLSEGGHQMVLAAPGMKRLEFKVFRGKQAGYVYHADLDPAACTQCHPESPKGNWTPGGGKGVGEGGLCGGCHEVAVKAAFVHGPVAAAQCSPCHDPHGSSNPRFLKGVGKDLCLSCHNQGLSAKHVAERKNADCTSCHDPHGSAKKYHLRDKN
jgi:predicted CXXCH cytochrome family protein